MCAFVCAPALRGGRWVAIFRVMIVLLRDVEGALMGQDLNGTVRVLKSFQASRIAMEFPELSPEEGEKPEKHVSEAAVAASGPSSAGSVKSLPSVPSPDAASASASAPASTSTSPPANFGEYVDNVVGTVTESLQTAWVMASSWLQSMGFGTLCLTLCVCQKCHSLPRCVGFPQTSSRAA